MKKLLEWVRLRYLAAADVYKRRKELIDVALIVGALVIVGISGIAIDRTEKPAGRATPSKWETDSLPGGMTPLEYARLSAERTVTNSGKTELPVLLIWCHEEEIDVLFSIGMPLEAKDEPFQEVRICLDDGPILKENWVRSSDVLHARNPILLMQRISKAKTMLIEVTALDIDATGGTRVSVIEFDVRGFDQHLASIEGACAHPGAH